MKSQTSYIVNQKTLHNIDVMLKRDDKLGVGPVKRVAQICRMMKNYKRGAVIAVCAEKGINPNTARTQYQQWYSTHKH